MDEKTKEEQYIEFRVQQQVMASRLDDLDVRVTEFYNLLKSHMDEESKERREMDKKLQWMLGFIILNALGQGGTVLRLIFGS